MNHTDQTPLPSRSLGTRPSRRVRSSRALACATVALLCGCQTMVPASWRLPPKHPPVPVVSRSTLDATDLLAYTQRLLALGRDELNQEISTRREKAQMSRSAIDRAKLAVALTLPNQGQRDTTRALLAMSDVPRDDPTLDAAGLALINYIEALLAWQARQEEALQALLQPERPASGSPAQAPNPAPELASLQALAQKLRADQKRSDGLIETLTVRLRDEKTRADSLQQKLDALGNLEKSLAERKPARAETPR